MHDDPFASTPLIIGHRGAAGLVAENTLPGFLKAVELGVAAVELDVHVCEGELVVIHDDTLERTTNGTGSVAAIGLQALRALDAGDGARIPLLAEVFRALPGEIGINVELKGVGTAEALARWLPDAGERGVLVSSFDHSALERFRALRGDHPVAPLFDRWRRDAIGVALAFGSGYINLSRRLIDGPRMEAITEAGLKALVYTVNDPAEARRFLAMGVWGVFTDDPATVSRAALAAG